MQIGQTVEVKYERGGVETWRTGLKGQIVDILPEPVIEIPYIQVLLWDDGYPISQLFFADELKVIQ